MKMRDKKHYPTGSIQTSNCFQTCHSCSVLNLCDCLRSPELVVELSEPEMQYLLSLQ
uniref:RNA-binding KH domain-containing protein PEPPER-like n=1 Tax=Rhizophora mucronata TaxID=61149 RepID=A0A2P2NS96_RHIMU